MLKQSYALLALIGLQVFCAVFFVVDAASDFDEAILSGTIGLHLLVEMIATLTLCAAIFFEVRSIFGLMQRKAQLERSASIASAAMYDVIEAHFAQWSLTLTGRDIATFLVKGLNIAEIADLRGSAEGTIKSHLNAIYRKSGTSGRGDLLSVIIDSLINTPAGGEVIADIET